MIKTWTFPIGTQQESNTFVVIYKKQQPMVGFMCLYLIFTMIYNNQLSKLLIDQVYEWFLTFPGQLVQSFPQLEYLCQNLNPNVPLHRQCGSIHRSGLQRRKPGRESLSNFCHADDNWASGRLVSQLHFGSLWSHHPHGSNDGVGWNSGSCYQRYTYWYAYFDRLVLLSVEDQCSIRGTPTKIWLNLA